MKKKEKQNVSFPLIGLSREVNLKDAVQIAASVRLLNVCVLEVDELFGVFSVCRLLI